MSLVPRQQLHQRPEGGSAARQGNRFASKACSSLGRPKAHFPLRKLGRTAIQHRFDELASEAGLCGVSIGRLGRSCMPVCETDPDRRCADHVSVRRRLCGPPARLKNSTPNLTKKLASTDTMRPRLLHHPCWPYYSISQTSQNRGSLQLKSCSQTNQNECARHQAMDMGGNEHCVLAGPTAMSIHREKIV